MMTNDEKAWEAGSRDFDKHPYTFHERRVCDYLMSLQDSIGCGEDPIGFLIASHNYNYERLSAQLQEAERALTQIMNEDYEPIQTHFGESYTAAASQIAAATLSKLRGE